MPSQTVFAAGTPTSDPSGLAMLNAGLSPQTAAAAQRSQDLARALAAMRDPKEDLRTPDASANDRLADVLMQRKYGHSVQGFAQAAGADQPWIAPPALSAPDQLSGGQTAGFAPATPAPQADTPQVGEVNFDDLIPNQGAPWRPSSSGAGAVHFGETVDNASTGSDSNYIELASNLKSQCIDECHPILERPRSFPGSNKI